MTICIVAFAAAFCGVVLGFLLASLCAVSHNADRCRGCEYEHMGGGRE